MQKVAVILFLGIFAGACSVARMGKNEKYPGTDETGSENILERVIRHNITSSSFYIQKAEIEISTENEKRKFLGSIKFEYPDKFLISLKSRSGIEGARIFIDNDSIFVNDRINKKLYFGTALNMKKKFGLNQAVMPLIFGDMIVDKGFNAGDGKCEDNKLNIDCSVRGILVNYNIDCRKSKVDQIKLRSSNLNERTDIKYSSFYYINNTFIPRVIEIADLQHNLKARIKIIRTEYPWNGDVRFLPGKGYELIEIL